jgi:hypothetical protein
MLSFHWYFWPAELFPVQYCLLQLFLSLHKFQVTLRLTVSQSVSVSWYRVPMWDLRQDIISFRNVAVWDLRSCIYWAPSLTRERVYNLQCNHSIVRVAQNPKPYFTVSSETRPTWRARLPYLYLPGIVNICSFVHQCNTFTSYFLLIVDMFRHHTAIFRCYSILSRSWCSLMPIFAYVRVASHVLLLMVCLLSVFVC